MKIAFYKGKQRLFNRFVSWWTQGPYSHCEAVFSEEDVWNPAKPMLCASSSFMDGGVRFKDIALDPEKWDVIEVPAIAGWKVRKGFRELLDWRKLGRRKPRYDILGLLSTSLPVPDVDGWYFCNEVVGDRSGLKEAWRFNPNSFARAVELLPGSRWIQRGPI